MGVGIPICCNCCFCFLLFVFLVGFFMRNILSVSHALNWPLLHFREFRKPDQSYKENKQKLGTVLSSLPNLGSPLKLQYSSEVLQTTEILEELKTIKINLSLIAPLHINLFKYKDLKLKKEEYFLVNITSYV